MSGVSADQLRKIERHLCETSFYYFVQLAWSKIDQAVYKDNYHVKVVCDHLQAVAEGRARKNLLINICPGVAKSLITSVFFPAWVWTTRPEASFLCVSNGEKLTIRDARKCRQLITSEWYQRHWKRTLQKDHNSKSDFGNSNLGYRVCSPISSATGKRANFVLVDDPHSVDDAKSDATRKTQVETFRGTLPTRLNDPEQDHIIVIMQRLHVEDVSGFVLENKEELDYDHLCIPYIADGVEREPTSIGWVDERKEGELMWPAHISEKTVAARKASLGPYGFAGQFQQNPVPEGAGFLQKDWFHRFDLADRPENLHYYMTSDHAPSGRETADYNVFRVWGVDSNRNVWLVDSFRKQCRMDEAFGYQRDPNTGKISLLPNGALPLIKKWQPLGWFPENDNTWVSNAPMVETAMRETGILCHIQTLPTRGGTKFAKAQAYQAMASAGLVHLPNGPMGDDALVEYAQFPSGKHDDQVDADGAIARAINDTMGAYIATVETAAYDPEDYSSPSYTTVRDIAWG